MKFKGENVFFYVSRPYKAVDGYYYTHRRVCLFFDTLNPKSRNPREVSGNIAIRVEFQTDRARDYYYGGQIVETDLEETRNYLGVFEQIEKRVQQKRPLFLRPKCSLERMVSGLVLAEVQEVVEKSDIQHPNGFYEKGTSDFSAALMVELALQSQRRGKTPALSGI